MICGPRLRTRFSRVTKSRPPGGTPIGHAISARISSSRPADFPAYVVALDPRHDNSRSVIRSHFGRRHRSGTPAKLPKRPNSHRVDRETIHQKKPLPHNDAPTAVPCLFLNIGRPVVSDTAPGPHAGKPVAAKVSGGGSRKRTTPPTIPVRNTRRGLKPGAKQTQVTGEEVRFRRRRNSRNHSL